MRISGASRDKSPWRPFILPLSIINTCRHQIDRIFGEHGGDTESDPIRLSYRRYCQFYITRAVHFLRDETMCALCWSVINIGGYAANLFILL